MRLSVTAREFEAAYNKIWVAANRLAPAKLGLAVSGGVDSFALTYLMHRYLANEDPSFYRCHAFIVDHKTRAGSTEEAYQVAARLESLFKIKPTILTIQWPNGVNPSKLENYEGQARRMRYRMLGEACRGQGIKYLLLGHHADDNAETVLARILQHARGRALQGMNTIAQIPECTGLHGVYQSGSLRALNSGKLRGVHGIESGGVSIVRPLLSFTKGQLIATCRDAEIEWFEDQTNHDPTYTKRNAYRSLLASGNLPVALRKQSLLELAQRARSIADEHDGHCQRLYDACEIQSFDMRSGLMIVHIPEPNEILDSLSLERLSITDKYVVLRNLLRRFFEMVSCMEKVGNQPLSSTVKEMFPSVFEEGRAIQPSKSKFTLRGVMIEKIISEKHVGEDPPNTTWRLSRQPYSSSSGIPLAFFPRMGTNSGDILPLLEKYQQHEPAYSSPAVASAQSPFVLWDGRFWINVEHKLEYPLLVVPLSAEGRSEFLKAIFEAGKAKGERFPLREFRLTENICTSPQNRLIVPAIVAPPGVDGLPSGTVLAVPTFGQIRPSYAGSISWDIRYKCFDDRGLVPVLRKGGRPDPFILHKPSSLGSL